MENLFNLKSRSAFFFIIIIYHNLLFLITKVKTTKVKIFHLILNIYYLIIYIM